MLNGLRDAGLQPPDIQYLNAHGAASTLGDATEVQAIRLAFGSHAQSMPVSSTKALHGHMLGATGAAELLALIVALNDGLIAPTANLYEPDPELDLDFVPLHARHGQPLKAAMSSNFAFGGSNACLVLAR
jgi:3-oxoacyl-(acyl-carrier-protein) synthase